MRILLVEDDKDLQRLLKAALSDAGYVVDSAMDGEEGHFLGDTEPYDAVILDLGLPKLDGVRVLEKWRKAGRTMPVLILTARDRWSDKVAGFDAGADDYLAKPFAFAVLVARIGALARRAQPCLPPVLEHGDLVVDTATRCARRAGRPLALRPKEFGVLELLLSAQGRVVSAEELLERVWDEAADPFTTTVKITISRLRGKLGDPPVIHTVAKAGYRI